jgi:hypothetical protein
MFSPTGDMAVRFILSHFCTAAARSNPAWDMAAHFILGDCYTGTAGCSPAWDMCHFCTATAGYNQGGDVDDLVSCVTSALLQQVTIRPGTWMILYHVSFLHNYSWFQSR